MVFQGGFVPKTLQITLKLNDGGGDSSSVHTFHPTDNNSRQTFQLSNEQQPIIDSIRIDMPHGSSDLYGRVILYSIDIY